MNEHKVINSEVELTEEESKLDQPITIGLILKFALPTIFAIVIMHTFAIIDGIFAMRALGMEAMAAITVFMPLFTIIMAIGMFFAIGGSAIIVKKLGEGKYREARQNYTFISVLAFALTLIVSIVIAIFPSAMLNILGANYEIYDLATTYLRIAVWAFPFMTIGQIFNTFLIADGKPGLGMGISVLGTLIGAGGNALVLFVFHMGIYGLAWTTVLGLGLTAIWYFIIFLRNKTGNFRFAIPSMDGRTFGSLLINGFSVGAPMIAGAIMLTVQNNVLVRLDGVGAMGIAIAGMVMGLQGMLGQVFTGYLQGLSGIIAFNNGKRNYDRLKRLFQYSLKIISVLSLMLLAISVFLAEPLMRIYLPSLTDPGEIFMREMAVRGLRIVSIAFVVFGFNMFFTGIFTALSKGQISTVLSLTNILAFNTPLIIILPRFFEMDGVWMALPIATGLAFVMSTSAVLIFGKRYNFIGKEGDAFEVETSKGGKVIWESELEQEKQEEQKSEESKNAPNEPIASTTFGTLGRAATAAQQRGDEAGSPWLLILSGLGTLAIGFLVGKWHKKARRGRRFLR